MQPEMYLVIYRQQERELEQRLFRQLQQTCCRAVAAARRSWWKPVVERLAAARRAPSLPACCPA
jgi:hypothetical protein